MHSYLKMLVLAFVALALVGCNSKSNTNQAPPQQLPTKTWFKGNTHAHTAISGHADSTPDEVAKWYFDNGYDFLVLSEHNHFIDPASVQLPSNSEGDFLLIPGLEITGSQEVHTTSINVSSLVPHDFNSLIKSEVIQRHVDDTTSHGGLAILNHPNWRYSINADDIKAVSGLHFFELFNGHPNVNNFGNHTHTSTEEMWDELLSFGMLIYGMSSDDAHQYKEVNPLYSNPGRGWIMVKSELLKTESIMASIRQGKFYSSNGVVLEKCSQIANIYEVIVDEEKTAQELTSSTITGKVTLERSIGFEIQFIGYNGVVLQKQKSKQSTFIISDDHEYIRPKIIFRRMKTNGSLEEFYAWCQPTFSDGRKSAIN